MDVCWGTSRGRGRKGYVEERNIRYRYQINPDGGFRLPYCELVEGHPICP